MPMTFFTHNTIQRRGTRPAAWPHVEVFRSFGWKKASRILSLALTLGLMVAPRSGLASAGGSGAYGLKQDLPHTPFSDAAAPLKDIPIGAGLELSFSGSWQMRAQSLENRRSFSYHKNDEDFSVLSRTRINLDLHHGDLFRLFVEGQDAHALFADHLPGPNGDNNAFDLYQGYLETGLLTDIADKPSLRIRLGRQEFQIGIDKIFGDFDWFNRGQTFDMARVTWRPEGFDIDFVAGRTVVFDHKNIDETGETNFAGYNLKAHGMPGTHKLEAYTFYKWDEENDFPGEKGTRGAERIWALGGHAEGTFFKSFDYGSDATFEIGERGGDDVLAWFTASHLGYTFLMNKRSLRLATAYTLASGDGDPTDGKAHAFDPLFGDPFTFHGKLLVAAPTNLEDFTFQTTARLWRGGKIELDYHYLRLHRSKGGLVNAANGALLRRDPTGQAGRRIGQALDLQITHTFHENLSISGGAFLFLPGRLFKHTGNRGHDPARNFFIMTRVSF